MVLGDVCVQNMSPYTCSDKAWGHTTVNKDSDLDLMWDESGPCMGIGWRCLRHAQPPLLRRFHLTGSTSFAWKPFARQISFLSTISLPVIPLSISADERKRKNKDRDSFLGRVIKIHLILSFVCLFGVYAESARGWKYTLSSISKGVEAGSPGPCSGECHHGGFNRFGSIPVSDLTVTVQQWRPVMDRWECLWWFSLLVITV